MREYYVAAKEAREALREFRSQRKDRECAPMTEEDKKGYSTYINKFNEAVAIRIEQDRLSRESGSLRESIPINYLEAVTRLDIEGRY